MAKIDAAAVTQALREAGASYLSPSGATYLRRRLAMGACLDAERERYNLGALRDLSFGHAERHRISAGEAVMAGEVTAEHQRAYRRGATSWVPFGALPSDSAERVRLFEERRTYAAKLAREAEEHDDPDMRLVDLDEDDVLGVGLASYPSLGRAAQELVRIAFRAAPRDWSEVEENELRALDTYPTLTSVAIPAATELQAPLGWIPGVGPSEAATETFLKLTADWEGFEAAANASIIAAEDMAGWRQTREAWRTGKLLPGELGEALTGEVARAHRVRRMLAGHEVEAEEGAAAHDGGEESAEDTGGLGGFLKQFGIGEKLMTGGLLVAATVAMLFSSEKKDPEVPAPSMTRFPASSSALRARLLASARGEDTEPEERAEPDYRRGAAAERPEEPEPDRDDDMPEPVSSGSSSFSSMSSSMSLHDDVEPPPRAPMLPAPPMAPSPSPLRLFGPPTSGATRFNGAS